MSLKSVAEALLLPPMSLLLVALVGLLAELRFRRIGRLLLWTGLLGLLVPESGIGRQFVDCLKEQDLLLTPPQDLPPQAIVILGGDVRRSGTQTLILHPGPLSLERVCGGAALFRRTGLPILVSGGALREGESLIAVIMTDSLVHDFQVPVRWKRRCRATPGKMPT